MSGKSFIIIAVVLALFVTIAHVIGINMKKAQEPQQTSLVWTEHLGLDSSKRFEILIEHYSDSSSEKIAVPLRTKWPIIELYSYDSIKHRHMMAELPEEWMAATEEDTFSAERYMRGDTLTVRINFVK